MRPRVKNHGYFRAIASSRAWHNLVEEMAAAASSLKNQADDLLEAVGVFKLPSDASSASRALSLR